MGCWLPRRSHHLPGPAAVALKLALDDVVLEVLWPSKANNIIDRLRTGTAFVDELAGEPESIHDIVVAPGWKCEQLSLQVAQPRSLGGNVKAAAQFHSASDALRSNRLIMTNRKFFEAGMTSALAHTGPQEGTDARRSELYRLWPNAPF